MSGTEVAQGRPGNLTPEQEEKLRQLWQLIFQVCGISGPEQNGSAKADAAAAVAAEAAATDKKAKKSRMSIFSRKSRKEFDADATPAPTTNSSVVLTAGKHSEEDKYGQTKHFYDTLASQSPESIRATIWGMVKHDHPDALVLRFLRARKWDVEKALVMLISTMNWRAQDMKVDEDIMKNGEAAALEAEKNAADPAAQKLGHDFLAQIRMGKSFIHGTDKLGRPICVVRVRLHKQGEQAEESLERYTVYLIETCRMLLRSPVDTATIIFDMTGFSMANMDYTPVKFMIKCFEANYPESLGTVLVHKSPWLFQGIWKVIKGWLDPVVANKVHFTNNVKEMEEFIPLKQIPKELEGAEDWEFAYVEPVAGENDTMKDTATRDRLLASREELCKEYEDTTRQWILSPESAEIKAKRTAIAAKLHENYWVVDPYVRARSLYDRTGVLLPGGKINYYPKANGVTESAAAPAAVAPSPVPVPAAPAPVVAPAPVAPVHRETSADDVD
ncbi:phosphatidylinositol transfer protein CSR1 [Podospora didyma]|uniref:Phosphatidylinositol transfer protein CSR1 n=1 Tax=Podospora didyma TaxID=330526 RepID=A0AAE0NP55_9PEZI|nr:phosphatidylinositol transfer protein CSR1 [Podospora didyma]